MRQSEAINWSVAILLSLLVHSMILISSGARMGEEIAIVSQNPIITRLSFNKLLDDTVLDEQQPIERQQPRPVKKVEVKPVQPKSAEAKPTETKPAEEKPIIRQIEPVRQVAIQEREQGRRVSDSSEKLLQQERKQYLHQLMRHIESFKYYPRAARKRSLEGEVKVSFILLDDGSYKQLSLDGRHSALIKASRVAMESAIPLPAPPNDMVIPGQIDFTMSYSLTH